MDASGVLDVIFGLSFFYLSLSLMVTALGEAVSHYMEYRSKGLEVGIKSMLQDDTKYQEILKHPIIQAFTPSDVTNKLPDYIPSGSFVLALFDILKANADPAAPDAQKLQGVLDSSKDTPLGNSLRALASATGNDLQAFRLEAEKWFDSTMDRVSGWYKRKVQFVNLILAALLVTCLNADSIRVATALWNDADLRQKVVAAADQSLASSTPLSGEQAEKYLSELSLPIGWTNLNFPNKSEKPSEYRWRQIIMILGLTISTLAAAQGAPFWFDTLNKVSNLRLAGKTPGPTTTPST